MLNVSIELTDACNLNCKMCSQFFKKGMPHGIPPKFMSYENWKRAILDLGEIERKIELSPFWDGEPLLHPRFDEFIRFAFDNNNDNKLFDSFRVNTNGTLLDDFVSDTILYCSSLKNQNKNTFGHLHFSIDAVKPETYQFIKGADVYPIVVKNIINFIKKREKRKLKYPKITVALIVMKSNFKEALQFKEFWVNTFKEFKLDYQITFDWPNKDLDGIYFRLHNSNNLKENETLHKNVAKEIGFNQTLRNKKSF